MAVYPINRGIGRSAEFKGLKAQYLFIFAVGLLAVLVLVVILYMIGISQYFCIGFGGVSASLVVWGTFYLNSTYGQYGLMKLFAKRSHPRFIRNRKTIYQLFTHKAK